MRDGEDAEEIGNGLRLECLGLSAGSTAASGRKGLSGTFWASQIASGEKKIQQFNCTHYAEALLKISEASIFGAASFDPVTALNMALLWNLILSSCCTAESENPQSHY